MRKRREGFGFGPAAVAVRHIPGACRIAVARGDFPPARGIVAETDQNPKQNQMERKHAFSRATRSYPYILFFWSWPQCRYRMNASLACLIQKSSSSNKYIYNQPALSRIALSAWKSRSSISPGYI